MAVFMRRRSCINYYFVCFAILKNNGLADVLLKSDVFSIILPKIIIHSIILMYLACLLEREKDYIRNNHIIYSLSLAYVAWFIVISYCEEIPIYNTCSAICICF